MPRKENTKAKTWERDRRSRMNSHFNSLAELLPPQQDGRKRNKVDIILHATKYIKELQSRTDNLIQTNASKAHKEELTRLKKLVHQLLLRTHLLSNLLQDAGITVPAEPALEKISPLKWSNKINVNNVDNLLNNCDIKNKNEEKKEKIVKNVPRKKKVSAKKPNNSENQENCVNSENKEEESNQNPKSLETESKELPESSTANQDDDFVPASESPEGSKNPKSKRKRNEAYKIASSTTVAVGNFPTGTLVFSGTKIMPVVTPISSLTPNIIMSTQSRPSSSPIILNNAQPSQMFVVQPLTSNPVRNSVISIQNQALINPVPNVIVNPRTWASNVKKMINSTKIGGHKGILPKGRENTKTTMTYKVPIPAIHKEKVDKKDKVVESKSKSSKVVKKQQENKKVDNQKEKVVRKRVSPKNDETSPKKKKSKPNEEIKKKDMSENQEIASSENNTEQSSTEIVENKSSETEKKKNEYEDKFETPKLAEDQVAISITDKEIIEDTNKEPTVEEEKSPEKEKIQPAEIIEPEKNIPEDAIITDSEKNLQMEVMPDSVLDNNFDLLQSGSSEIVNETIIAESNKILLNLDTNTTTTMKLETSVGPVASTTTLTSSDVTTSKPSNSKDPEEVGKHLSYSSSNTFVPINKSEALHSDLSNDIFASLQVPSSSHNPESISPTVAFLTAFPLVSSLSGKAVVLEEEMKDDFNHSQTPPMLLQIGAMEPNSFKIKSSCDGIENTKKIGESKSTESTKSLPKIISSETLKEPFKIVQSEPKVDINISNNNISNSNNNSKPVNTSTEVTNSKSVVDESLSSVSISENPTDEMSQFSNQNKNQFLLSKDNTSVMTESSRNNPYNYQVCPINNYNSRNNNVSFENMRQDYLVRDKPTSFPNTENIEADCNKPIHQPISQTEKIASTLEHSNENFSSQKKIETTDFSISYDSGEKQKSNLPEPKDPIINITEANTNNNNNYQRRSNETQPYMDPYGKGGKKIVPSSSSSNDKSIRSSYSQQQESFVTSNYAENPINRQSTTTMAHNSSNFSILSWTTVSPASGTNNNIPQFDQSSSQNDLQNQSKTICENLNYLPLQKDNNSVPNTMSYAPPSNTVTYDKSRPKQSMEVQKRSYTDPSKNRNLRSIISSQKQTRNQPQNAVNDYTKFSGENNKNNKLKYSMDLDYMPNEFLNIDPRQQQPHHQQKQPVKQDKSNYMIADFDLQTQFDSEQNNSRYNSDIYVSSNFKSQQISSHKSYQVQSQVPQHNQQQQQQQPQQQKLKQSQNSQQQIRPPVNWMMTPEIKHNNLGDIILPPIGKELEFCQNNFFSQTPSYNQTAPNQFYNNYDHSFPIIQGDSKKAGDSSFYTEEQPFSWSPTKSMPQTVEQNQSLKIDQHVPTTLPTLVGDLALGTNLPEKQNFLFSQRPEVPKEKEKESRDYQMLGQNQSQGMSFLSVSQLVEQEKAEKHQQQHNHHQQQQHQQNQQQRKHQRKSNASPRGCKKQLETIRKQHEEQKTGFSDQTYQQQQQKYQQNENVNWRTRNCKSNYTAEALIGNDTGNLEKNAKYNYSQNKFTEPMMPINYFPNVDNTGGYGQVVNQNFNHSYGYSSNANIYPNTNFITGISNNPTNYMMSLHDNSEYLDSNNFLLPPNVATSTSSLTNPSVNTKNQHFSSGKHNQNCDKRSYTASQKKSKRKADVAAQNFEFPLSGIASPLEDYHHTASFLPHTAPLYQNHGQVNVYPKGMNGLPPPPPPAPVAPSGLTLPPSSQGIAAIPPSAPGITATNPMVMHHPSGTSLTNFNLTTIFPEMNDKVTGYKASSNVGPSGLVQSTHTPTSYPQRVSYTNSLGHMTQVSDSAHFASDLPRPPTSEIVHYKNP